MAEPDMTLINELWEDVERNPPGIQARKLLVEQFIAVGWLDAARDALNDLSRLWTDEDIQTWNEALSRDISTAPPPSYTPVESHASSTKTRTSARASDTIKTSTRQPNALVMPATLPSDPRELRATKQNLIQSYQAFRTRAKLVLRDGMLLQSLRRKKSLPALTDSAIAIDDLEALMDGKITTVLRCQPTASDQIIADSIQNRPPESARAVARKIVAKPENAVDIVVSDLGAMAKYLRSSGNQPSAMDTDMLREMLAKRVQTLASALPENLKPNAHTAMMHIEHEFLKRTYVNDETMLGDTIVEIPRELFYVTEDNFAWSMDELAQAISSNNGVMRNPLSKHMFTPNDIRGILQHPLGKPLAALGLAQSKLKQGVRPKTIEEMERMANVFMADMAQDALKSREAVDEFLAYLATLPEIEQKAIDSLSVPAKDSHTGQAFDGTIGEAVRDAKANKLCFHKAGDFIKQACTYLRKR